MATRLSEAHHHQFKMPQPPAAAYRANHSLSASIIFTPKENKQYLQWQRQTLATRKCAFGRLPTATQYVEFRKWKEEQDRQKEANFFPDPCAFSNEFAAHLNGGDYSRSKTQEMAACGHALSLGIRGKEVERCPCCLIECHLQFMDVLTNRLDEVEEPLQRRSEAGKVTHPTYEAWYCAKLEMIQTVHELEAWADEEEAWMSQAGPEQLKNAKTATEALELYWSTITCPLAYPTGKKCIAKPKKRVSFGQDTAFQPGRDPMLFFLKSPRYEPGKYSSSEEDDTSEPDSSFDEDRNTETLLDHDASDEVDEIKQEDGEGPEEDYEADSGISESDSDDEIDEQVAVQENEGTDDCDGFVIVFTED